MRLSFTSLAYPELSLSEVLKRAVEMGFDGVELRVADDGIHLRPEHPIPSQQLKLIKSYGLPVPVLSSYLRLSDFAGERREHAERLARVLVEMAGEVDADGVRIYAGDPTPGYARIAEFYRQISDLADEVGVEILLETHDTLAEVPEIARLLREISEVKFLYDPANLIFAGYSHKEVFKLMFNRIRHVHLKDFRVSEGKRIFTKPGEGIVPLIEIVSDLKEAGYDRYISVEWERFWHRELASGDEILPAYRDYLRCLL